MLSAVSPWEGINRKPQSQSVQKLIWSCEIRQRAQSVGLPVWVPTLALVLLDAGGGRPGAHTEVAGSQQVEKSTGIRRVL